jgi:hypothetical protein
LLPILAVLLLTPVASAQYGMGRPLVQRTRTVTTYGLQTTLPRRFVQRSTITIAPEPATVSTPVVTYYEPQPVIVSQPQPVQYRQRTVQRRRWFQRRQQVCGPNGCSYQTSWVYE